jgi:hypothetical protein
MQTWLARMGEAAGRGFAIRPMLTVSQGTRDGQLVRSIHWRWLARRHWSRLARTVVSLGDQTESTERSSSSRIHRPRERPMLPSHHRRRSGASTSYQPLRAAVSYPHIVPIATVS